jgi:hypothetical protein
MTIQLVNGADVGLKYRFQMGTTLRPSPGAQIGVEFTRLRRTGSLLCCDVQRGCAGSRSSACAAQERINAGKYHPPNP